MKAIKNTNIYLKEVKKLKKAFVILLALGMLFAMTSIAFALQEPTSSVKGNIVPNTYTKVDGPSTTLNGDGDYKEYIQGSNTMAGGTVNLNNYDPTSGIETNTSTHLQGTWNSPYTEGIDGYNYNDPQDYVADGTQYDRSTGQQATTASATSDLVYASGPHGGYLTSTHKCRECHAVHRAAGKFKLLRSDTRFEACDWCHGTGAGSGFNIQMDNDDAYTQEYNVGHTMGFGISSGKWKAPDDTYPAFTPNYWMGGFSCFDCHSPHANPSRLFGMNASGAPSAGIKSARTGMVYNIVNSGHDMTDVQVPGSIENDMGKNYLPAYDTDTAIYFLANAGGNLAYPPTPGSTTTASSTYDSSTITKFVDGVAPDGLGKPWYLAGSWLLIKNPDRELTSKTTDIAYDSGVWYWDSTSGKSAGTILQESDITVTAGGEISDMITERLTEWSGTTAYPVNKMAIDWNVPIGMAKWANISPLFPTIVSAGVVPGFVPSDTANQRNMTLYGSNIGTDADDVGKSIRNPLASFMHFTLDEFCTDCHDGNAGRHTIQAPLFSEDRALRNGDSTTNDWKSNYDLAYGHDVDSRHCGIQMKFNPEDNLDAGPRCRNCHKGSSGCGTCHSTGRYVGNTTSSLNEQNTDTWPNWPGYQSKSMYRVVQTSTGDTNTVAGGLTTTYNYPNYSSLSLTSAQQTALTNKSITYMIKSSREADWYSNWRMATSSVAMGQKMTLSGGNVVGAACNGDGFSWPHRTLGWKMLKDDLFGLDFDGSPADLGTTRDPGPFFDKDMYTSHSVSLTNDQLKTHDIDSVCLDCHNPTIWNDGQVQSQAGHLDDQTKDFDNKNDELIQRGLP